jgi:hypothetical protein
LPLWIGAVTYDRSVGLSHRTVQIKDQLWSAIRPLMQSLPGE